MDRDEVWQAIDAQRLSLTDLLEQLSDDEWRQPSLCEGWTVRDVAGHLAWQESVRVPATMVDLVRARGNLHRAIHDAACRHATRPVEQIIAQIRGTAATRIWTKQSLFRVTKKLRGFGSPPSTSPGPSATVPRLADLSTPYFCCSPAGSPPCRGSPGTARSSSPPGYRHHRANTPVPMDTR